MAKEEPGYDPGELAGTEWFLVSLNGHGLVKGTTVTLDFDEDAMRGSAGCNEYGTDKLETDGGVFRPGGMMSTTVGCSGAVGRQEKTYMRTLEEVTTYRRQGDRLELRNAAGETTLVYAQRPQHRSDPADYIYHRDDSLTLETLAVTKMACEDPEGIMQQEQRYLRFLKDVKGYYQKVDGRLHLVVTDERMLVFRP